MLQCLGLKIYLLTLLYFLVHLSTIVHLLLILVLEKKMVKFSRFLLKSLKPLNQST